MAEIRSIGMLDLPMEILISLPEHLHNIEDFVNLSSTCRAFHNSMSAAPASSILRLAAASSRIFFRPSPHFLVAATARQLANWSSKSVENLADLRDAFRNGMEGLLDLYVEHCGLSISSIRDLHLQRFLTINPITDLIDLCVGTQWYQTPDFWYGGVEDAYTIDVDPPETYFHLVIYGELFGPSLNEFVSSGRLSPLLEDINLRLDFVKYCIPDWACYTCQDESRDVKMLDGRIDPRRAVDAIGPYKSFRSAGESEYTHGNQVGLKHMLESPRWNPPWTAVRESLGRATFSENWKQHLWESVIWLQGTDSMRLLMSHGWEEIVLGKGERKAQGGMEEVKEALKDLRVKIEEMEQPPKEIIVGRQRTYEFPFLRGDLHICRSGYNAGS